MWRVLFIAFLLVHGLIHLGIWMMPKPADPQQAPFDPWHSWVAGDRRTLAQALAAVAAILFVTAGAGLFGRADWWRPLTVAASGFSLLLMALYFHPWLSLGVGINAGLIAAISWLEWPSRALVGA